MDDNQSQPLAEQLRPKKIGDIIFGQNMVVSASAEVPQPIWL